MRWCGVVVVAWGLSATGCTVALSSPGVVVACAPLVLEVNIHDSGFGSAELDAVVGAVEEYGALVGRTVSFAGATSSTAAEHEPGDPLLIEITWPDDAPAHLGFAQPVIDGDRYLDGWVYLHPGLASAPAGVIRRLVLHELGHLYGLLDVADPAELMNPALTVDDWGPGDLTGLFVTHEGGCGDDAALAGRLLDALRAAESAPS